MNKCLGCQHKIEKPHHFCSFTCACLCGYYDVKTGWIKDPSKITQEEINKFLSISPVREKYPDKDKYL